MGARTDDGRWGDPSPADPGCIVVQGVAAGRRTIEVWAPGLGTARSEVVVGDDGAEVAVALPRGEAVEGTVTDDLGRPVPGALVRAAVPLGRDEGAGGGLGVTDADGRFRVEGLERGVHTVTAVCGGAGESLDPPAVATDAPASGVRLVAPRAGALRIRLASPSAADADAEVRCSVRTADPATAEHTFLFRGWAPLELSGLRPGAAQVRIVVRGRAACERAVTIESGETTEAEVRLQEGAPAE